MSTEQWATLSNNAVAAATVVFGLACIAHLIEWSITRQVSGADTSRAETVGAEIARPARQAVSAGQVGAFDGGQDAQSRRELAGEELGADEERVARFGRLGIALTVLAAACLLVGVVSRGFAAERAPWGNMYEFATLGLLVVVTIYLGLVRFMKAQWLGGIVTGFAVCMLGLAFLAYVPAGPLVPALDSYWLLLHVSAAATAGGAFTIGAGASIFYLLKAKAERETPEDQRTGYLWRLPSSTAIDRLAYRVHAFAFPVWTFAALIAGPIWAEHAWGRYWGWDPKEVWAFITWVVYAGYLHARATAGWRGKGAAIIALIGFATFLFDFIGVNLIASGQHTYSGL
ncbi:MAG TPA: c-type cytochrome biogenesis protein CcsB [Nocardioidaceae bacterium]|nr:c-type cytochrome biogenesis protein CcsB [Nocardioidaceae bacterium]